MQVLQTTSLCLPTRQSNCNIRGYFPGSTRSPVEGIPIFAVPAASTCFTECQSQVPNYKSTSLSRHKTDRGLVCNCWPRSLEEATFGAVTVDTNFQEPFFYVTCDPAAVDAVVPSLVLLGAMTATVDWHLRGRYPTDKPHGSQIFPPFLIPEDYLTSATAQRKCSRRAI
jgi:hypothetical protein